MPQQRRRSPTPPRRATAALAVLGCALALSAHARPPLRAEGGQQPAQAEGREQVRRQLEALVGSAPLSTGKVSALVLSLDDGSTVWARNENDQLNPASNTKVVTAAAALLRLGLEYRFTTDLLGDAAPAKGRVKTLFVKGRGDPSFTTERLQGMAADLAHRGLRQVGELVLDDTWFDREIWGPGWETENSDKAYAAPSGALSLNHNSVGVYVVPADKAGQKARVELEPEAKGFFQLENRVQTLKAGARKRLLPHTLAAGEHTRVIVSGRVAAGGETVVMYRRVTDPTLYFGYALREALQDRGIKVERLRRGTAPEAAQLIASYESPGLSEIVRDMNKASSNFIAEMLLRALGAETKGAPGTWAKGVEAAEDVLAELGLPRGSYQLRNGSGLNDTNRFSARQLVQVLAAMWKRFPVAAEFVSSLAVAARDGTLRTRMEGTEAAGRLRAKTGTLDKVTALSGYLSAVSGERFVFSVIVNDWSGKPGPVLQAVDRLGGLLASVGAEPGARDALLAQGSGELTAAELKARVATYAQLAAARDKKNLAFLRTAARSERDPLARVVAADALFRTDPESGGGALLEALPASPELLVRLRELGRELLLPLPLPVVSSLLDLAAEGNGEALARLLAAAPLARPPPAPPEASALAPDPALEEALAEGLFDVSEAAPEETLAALKTAPAEQARAALDLLALGLARSGAEVRNSALGALVAAAAAREGAEAAQADAWLAILEQRTSLVAVHASEGAGASAPAPAALAAPAAPAPEAAASAPPGAPAQAAAPGAALPAPATAAAAPAVSAPPTAPSPPAPPDGSKGPSVDAPPPGAPPHSLPAVPGPLLLATPPVGTPAPAPAAAPPPAPAATPAPGAAAASEAAGTAAKKSEGAEEQPRKPSRRRRAKRASQTDATTARAAGGG